MPTRLRVGIIGIGRRWRRYRPALTALREHLEVRALCDQLPSRAEEAARQLGCAATAGVVDLLERDDVAAVLLLDAQWFGLWPLEQACRVRKPVFCSLAPLLDDPHAEDLRRRIQAADLAVMTALGPAVAPAVLRLNDLVVNRLGSVRVVRCDWTGPRRPSAPARPFPGARALPALLYACANLLEGEPIRVKTEAPDGAGFASVLAEFGDGRVAQINLTTGFDARPACRFHVTGEWGVAVAQLPRSLRWRDEEGRHAQRPPRQALPYLQLERFLDCINTGRPPQPDFADACRALTWTRAALTSLAEGRRVEISGS